MKILSMSKVYVQHGALFIKQYLHQATQSSIIDQLLPFHALDQLWQRHNEVLLTVEFPWFHFHFQANLMHE